MASTLCVRCNHQVLWGTMQDHLKRCQGGGAYVAPRLSQFIQPQVVTDSVQIEEMLRDAPDPPPMTLEEEEAFNSSLEDWFSSSKSGMLIVEE